MTPVELMNKAQRSLKTARLAFEGAYMDGACNSAYYAMFSAARAALHHFGHQDAAMAKTHAGLISAVGQHLVIVGHLSHEHGRSLSRISDIRLSADYLGAAITEKQAQAALEKASEFVEAVATHCIRP